MTFSPLARVSCWAVILPGLYLSGYNSLSDGQLIFAGMATAAVLLEIAGRAKPDGRTLAIVAGSALAMAIIPGGALAAVGMILALLVILFAEVLNRETSDTLPAWEKDPATNAAPVAAELQK